MSDEHSTFEKFWPFYLSQHSRLSTRICHYVGTGAVLCLLAVSIATGAYRLLWALPVVGYLPAWIGHFVFEHNRPATFKQPVFSLIGDFKMFFRMLLRRDNQLH